MQIINEQEHFELAAGRRQVGVRDVGLRNEIPTKINFQMRIALRFQETGGANELSIIKYVIRTRDVTLATWLSIFRIKLCSQNCRT